MQSEAEFNDKEADLTNVASTFSSDVRKNTVSEIFKERMKKYNREQMEKATAKDQAQYFNP